MSKRERIFPVHVALDGGGGVEKKALPQHNVNCSILSGDGRKVVSNAGIPIWEMADNNKEGRKRSYWNSC